MKIIYCLPIIKNSKLKVLDIINFNKNDYDYFEIWLDYVEDLDIEFIDKLIKVHGTKLILLFRRKNLEPIELNLKKRFEIITILDKTNTFLDLDISQKEELSYIEENNLNIRTILSYHNYKETPDSKHLNEIVAIIKKHKPEVIKISTMCNSKKDAIRLLNLQQILKSENLKHIVLGMGNEGLITRVFASLWGNEMVFAPIKMSENSAPGQLTKTEMEKIFSIILKS